MEKKEEMTSKSKKQTNKRNKNEIKWKMKKKNRNKLILRFVYEIFDVVWIIMLTTVTVVWNPVSVFLIFFFFSF